MFQVHLYKCSYSKFVQETWFIVHIIQKIQGISKYKYKTVLITKLYRIFYFFTCENEIFFSESRVVYNTLLSLIKKKILCLSYFIIQTKKFFMCFCSKSQKEERETNVP